MKKKAIEERKAREAIERRGVAARTRDHNAVLRATGDRRAAIRAYCAGNRWLEENAKAVGNW
jgi:hypothetical protein